MSLFAIGLIIMGRDHYDLTLGVCRFDRFDVVYTSPIGEVIIQKNKG
jgi:hypothetical protein